MINLFSDTQTRPTPAMRAAMAHAEVGDEQRGLDPAVNALCRRVAGLLGKEAALFLPSGAMCNLVAILVHCRPGDEIIAEAGSHIVNFEAGGAAALAGAMVRPIQGDRGIFVAADLAKAIRAQSRYAPRSRLVAVEQTANLAGGTIWPLPVLEEVAGLARAHGLATHMDGARLLNAVVESGLSAADQAAMFDSCWIDLSKGLGCPVGAVLAGSADFIQEAWQWKQRLGGAMRQAGILAAAGLHALEHHVDRLAQDHANARRLSDLLAGVPGLHQDDARVETNMVFFDVSALGVDAAGFVARLAERGVEMVAMGPTRVRAVTHLDVGEAEIDQAAEIVARLAKEILAAGPAAA